MIPEARQNRRKPAPKPRPAVRAAVQNIPQRPAQTLQQGAPEPGVDPYDLSTDPVLARILATGIESRQHAQAAAARAQADLDLEYGVGAAGAANPHSILRKLAENEQRAPGQLDEKLGANLFYGGYRGTKQSDLARDLLEARTNAGNTYRTRTSGVADSLRGLLLGFDREDNDAREAAAARRVTQLGDTAQPAMARPAISAITRMLPTKKPKRPSAVHRPIGGGYDG